MSADLRLGLVGAGRFATFLAAVVAAVDGLRLVAVADPEDDAAARLAAAHGLTAYDDWHRLIADEQLDVVVVATPPATHAEVAIAALRGGRHVFCEKPLATTLDDARGVATAVEETGRTLVVDHVLRYNPLVHALCALRDQWLGPVQRLAFDNDASDEDLPDDHWFWDERQSGGIFVEHGVHFFDVAHLLLGSEPIEVAAVMAARPDGTVDQVSATVLHPDGAIATHTHSFTHAGRCERQRLLLDHATATVSVEGWIPLRAQVIAWTDDEGAAAAAGLPGRAAELFAVPGHRLGADAGITVQVQRDAGDPSARARGRAVTVPHRVRVDLEIGDRASADGGKARVYAESVRAALTDLVTAAAGGAAPRSGPAEALAAVTVADAARRSATEHRHVLIEQSHHHARSR